MRLARSGDSDRKVADGKGLYLLVTTTGSKLWRFKYRLNGEKKLALGSYPDVSLKDARARRDEARKNSQAGRDPAVAKREARLARHIAAANTFEAVAAEYIAKLEAEGLASVTIAKTRWLFSKLKPALAPFPIHPSVIRRWRDTSGPRLRLGRARLRLGGAVLIDRRIGCPRRWRGAVALRRRGRCGRSIRF